ncbi:hypothetical protein HY251_22345, partial [bacterium]|nr:hypothetical protein [bacterium]
MPLSSADKSFGLIAVEKKLLSKEALAAEEAALLANGAGVSLASHLVSKNVVSEEKKQEIEKIRSRHGRPCEKCLKDTFLLPGETEASKPCEHCGGKLRARPQPAGAPAKPASSPGMPKVAPPSASTKLALGKLATAAPSAPGKKPEGSPPSGTTRKPEKPAESGSPPDEAKAREERARRLRLQGAGFGYEPGPKPEGAPAPAGVAETSKAADGNPAAPPAAPPRVAELDPKVRATRAKNLRLQGAGFGYEPQEPEPAKPIPAPADAAAPAVGTPVDAAAAPPREGEPPLETWRPGRPIFDRTAVARPTTRLKEPEVAAAPAAGILPTSAVPLSSQWLDFLAFPLRARGPIFLCAAAVFVGLAVWALRQSTGNIFARFSIPICFIAIIYFNAFQAKVLNASTAGKTEPPDWPDIEETRELGWRLFCVEMAAFLPFLLVWVHILMSTFGVIGNAPTIGPDAHKMARKDPRLVGMNAAEVELLDMDDKKVKLGNRGGKWLVLALLDKDTADDTGMSKMIREMPKGSSFTAPYLPANQVSDLYRASRALPDVDWSPLFIDPRKRCLAEAGLYAPAHEREVIFQPSSSPLPTPRHEKEDGGDDEDLPRGPKPPDINKLPIPGNEPKFGPGPGQAPPPSGEKKDGPRERHFGPR